MSTKKERIRALRRPFETGGFIVLKTLIPLLPRWGITALSRMAERLAMTLPIREKRIGLKNMDAVFGDSKSPAEKRRILQTSFATFCQTMLDVFWFAKNPEKRIARYVDFEESPGKQHLFKDQAAICITAHIGSWEVMGQTAALHGIDLASIAATVKNPAVDRILIQQRERTGQTIIPQKGALRTLIARFRKNGKAAFVLDQKTAAKDGGVVVDFLGLPMPVSSAPAALAIRTGTDIIFGFCLPTSNGRYSLQVPKFITADEFPTEPDADEAARILTQRIMNEVSEEIRKHPQFWLWSYKHWRRTSGGSYPENYPSY